VMAGEYLGDVFDIHGGGVDLVFPHHENEIAQSRCAHGTITMANYWLHNGYLQVEGEKMSKSTGNFITIRDVLDDWPGDVVRLAMLKTHYRQPIDWTLAALKESASVLESWADATSGRGPGMFCADVTNALQDDLNTPKAIAALHELRKGASAGFDGARASLMAGANMLGLLTAPAGDRGPIRRRALKLDENVIADRVTARLAAREAKDFGEADRIRGELEAMGIRLMDRKDPATGATTTEWEVK
jgi:cysteinyl-tRNA synthetase